MASVKCVKCGETIQNVSAGIVTCPKCGNTMKIVSKSENLKKENSTQKKTGMKKNKKEKKGVNKTLGIIAVVVLSLGVIGSLLPDSGEKEEEAETEESSESIWAEDNTELEDFEYYVDGDKIHINGYKGKDKKIKIGRSYNADGKDVEVESVSGAPFLGDNLESVIVEEGITTLDNSTFNSCGAKYAFLPSTIQNVDDSFWGYFHEVEKIYFGGTQEQWESICKVEREDIDCKWIYCNVKVEELNGEDSDKQVVLRWEPEGNNEENIPVEETQTVNGESGDYDFNFDFSGKGEISEPDYKASCVTLGYEDILRNPDSYKGQNCVVSGTVDQIIEGWFGSFSIFVVDPNGNKWGCTYFYKENESHLLEGDVVTLYGECRGTDTTRTILGEQVTMPRVDVEYIH